MLQVCEVRGFRRPIGIALSLIVVAGCQKLEEMTTEKKATPSVPSPPPSGGYANGGAAPGSAPPSSAPASPKSPKEIIAAFFAKAPGTVTNADLEELAKQPEGLDQITTLSVADSHVGDPGVSQLVRLKNIENLNLAGTLVTGAGLTVLAELPKLTTLTLDRTVYLEDAGYASLAKCPGLKELSLQSAGVTDALFTNLKGAEGLEVLRIGNCLNMLGKEFSAIVKAGGFSKLRELYVGNSTFVYYGLLELNQLKDLEVLEVSHPLMNDGFIPNFQACSKLRRLAASNSAMSNEGLKLIARFPKLEELELNGCKGINDGGLPNLKTEKQLKKLNLDGASCTVGAVQELKKSLPNTAIRFAGQDL
jgi:hypothetical protein